jgi:hypothetical protein
MAGTDSEVLLPSIAEAGAVSSGPAETAGVDPALKALITKSAPRFCILVLPW